MLSSVKIWTSCQFTSSIMSKSNLRRNSINQLKATPPSINQKLLLSSQLCSCSLHQLRMFRSKWSCSQSGTRLRRCVQTDCVRSRSQCKLASKLRCWHKDVCCLCSVKCRLWHGRGRQSREQSGEREMGVAEGARMQQNAASAAVALLATISR